jgi:long-chain fatty acid transport protein
MSRVSPVWTVVSTALVVASSFSDAFASGFQLFEQSASGLGNAYAGQAAGVGDASAVFFNPAALTRLKGKQVVAAFNAIDLSTTFGDKSSGRPFLPPGLTLPVTAGTTGGNAGGIAPVPNAYLSWQAGSRVWLGMGVNAPFGLKTEWDPGWVGRFHAVKSDVRTLNFNPSLAIKVSDNLSIGAGASYQRLRAELTQAVPYGGIAVGIAGSVSPLATAGILAQLGGPSGLATEGLCTVEGDAWTLGYNAGALLQAGEWGRLGVSYRSAIRHDLSGTAAFQGSPTLAQSGPLGTLGAAINARFSSGPVTTRVELPETFSVAGAVRGSSFEVLADWTWTGWSSIQDLTIRRRDGSVLSTVPLNFKDTWRAGVGLDYRIDENWLVRVGTAFDRAPVQDAFRTPRLPDNDRTWAAGGFQRRVGKAGALDVGYAHIFVKDAASSRPNQDSPTSAPAGALVGTYAGSVNIVSAQVRWSF